MEHRIGKRRPLENDVFLSQCGRKLGRFPARNISLGGLGLKGSDDRLVVNSVVTVGLLSEEDAEGVSTSRKMRAVVVHQNNGTIGLMWIEKELVEPELLTGSKSIGQGAATVARNP